MRGGETTKGKSKVPQCSQEEYERESSAGYGKEHIDGTFPVGGNGKRRN
jgi:hypothetical protein